MKAIAPQREVVLTYLQRVGVAISFQGSEAIWFSAHVDQSRHAFDSAAAAWQAYLGYGDRWTSGRLIERILPHVKVVVIWHENPHWIGQIATSTTVAKGYAIINWDDEGLLRCFSAPLRWLEAVA